VAGAASVSESAIDDFEHERCQPVAATNDAIRRVLEKRSAWYSYPGDDVRISADTSAVR
jgi:hypothetical protein